MQSEKYEMTLTVDSATRSKILNHVIKISTYEKFENVQDYMESRPDIYDILVPDYE